MPGRQLSVVATGDSYQKCADLLLSLICSVVPVSQPSDFGIDFYCQPRIPNGPRTETVAELCSIQVKGGQAGLKYGGLDTNREWKQFEFAWLRSLATPLYLAHVDRDCNAVELFSLWPLWWIFLKAGVPFEVVFTTQPASQDSHIWQEPQASRHNDGEGNGDGMLWTVNLGSPFLRLTMEDLRDPAFRERAVTILRAWIIKDRRTLMLYQLAVPVVTSMAGWSTNSTDGLMEQITYFGNTQPGMNISPLCQTAALILVNLCFNLKAQNDEATYKLVPVLQWLDSQGHLDELGRGLLRDFRDLLALEPPSRTRA